MIPTFLLQAGNSDFSEINYYIFVILSECDLYLDLSPSTKTYRILFKPKPLVKDNYGNYTSDMTTLFAHCGKPPFLVQKFNFIGAAVCLYFMLNFSCLFIFHDEFYLFVYNFHSRSAICLYFMVNFICLFT